MTNVTKLTGSNFLMWSRQVHALLDGYDLAGYIVGSIAVPSATITSDDDITTNPAYTLWKRQDRLIYSSLLGAITPTIQPIMSTASTASEIWQTLTMTYAKPSRAHVKQIRQQIQNWKKGSKSINEYFQGLTTRFDELALLGKALDHEDQIEFVLDGLPEEYKTIADQIDGRETPPSLPEIHEKLLNQEAKLQTITTPVTPAPVTANFTNHRGSFNQNRGNHNNNNSRRGGYREPNLATTTIGLLTTAEQLTWLSWEVSNLQCLRTQYTGVLNFLVVAPPTTLKCLRRTIPPGSLEQTQHKPHFTIQTPGSWTVVRRTI